MRTPQPVAEVPHRGKRVLIVLDDGAGLREEGSMIAAGGEGGRRVKRERFDDLVAGDPEGSRAGGRAVVAIAPPPRNPLSPSSRTPVAMVRTARQPEIIVLDDDDDDVLGGSGDRLQEDLLIAGSREGGRPIKAEPLDYSGCNSEELVAGGRAMVEVSKPRRIRGREAPRIANACRAGGRYTGPGNSGETRNCRGGGGNPLSSAFLSSEESSGAPGKVRGGGRMRSVQRRGSPGWDGAAPEKQASSGVASRTRSRTGEQGRVKHAKYSVQEAIDDGEEEEEEVEDKDVKEEEEVQMEVDENSSDNNGGGHVEMEVDENSSDNNGGGHVEMEVDEDSSDNNGVGKHREQEDDVMGKNTEDDNGDSEDKCRQGRGTKHDAEAAAAAGEKELGEDEDDGVRDNSDDTLDEEGSEEEDEEEESNEPGEEPHCAPGNAMAGGDAGSGDEGTRIFGRRMFEGLCFPEQVDTTAGTGLRGRTRSNFKQRKCLDKKLLKRGTYSKPYCIDASESEEDIPPPEQRQKPPTSGGEDDEDDISSDGLEERTTATKRRKFAPSDDSEEDRTFAWNAREGSSSGRARKGAPYRQIVKEDCNSYDGSNPQLVKNNGANAGSPTDRGHAQDDITFKKNAQIALGKKHGRKPVDQRLYDDLIDSIFDKIKNHQNDHVPIQDQSLNRFPTIFSFGDEDKMKNNSEQDELLMELDFALESINSCSHIYEKDEKSHGQEIPADKATSCNQGKHHLIIDEQIGVRCKYCDFIDLEIRYVLPSMEKFSMETESKINPKLDLLFDDILTSMGNEGPSSFGGHKTGKVWDLIPGVREDMFPHQQEGFEFMWTKLAGDISIEQLKHTVNTDVAGGCVISHAPGTGKTRLAITFVQSYLELFPLCSPMIIAPRGMLATWEQEFRKWNVKLPFHVLNSSEIHWNEDKTIQGLVAKDEKLGQKLSKNKLDQKSRRALKLKSWHEGSSIIGVSYSLFRKLAKDEGLDGQKAREVLLERPDLLVLDEGHTPRNKKSLIWKVLAEVRTEKRIILSGTPFQNNLLELYNILCLVRPKFAREFASKSFKKKDFASKRTSQPRAMPHFDSKQDMPLEKDEGKDFWTSLTLNNITDENIDEIRKILDPFVHIHNGDILQKSLPGLRESVVILNPLPHQKEIIAKMENLQKKNTRMENTVTMGTLDAEYKISLASVHPFLITCTKLSDKEASIVNKPLLKSLRLNPLEGVKTRFVLEIVRLCEALKERVLVFSQYLEPLSLIMDQLTRAFRWTVGREILLMSGNVLVKNRHALMEAFNDMNNEARVMLASTKACCEGITLVGASRVVLLDVVWNPSVGRQAIGRAYRIGQEKIVHTYNLIAEGTKEKHKFDRQAKKDHMSKKLFSNEPQTAVCNLSPELIFNDRILEAMTAHDDLKDMFVQILRPH